MSNLHQIEVVGDGSKTQLLVGENLNSITQQCDGQNNGLEDIRETYTFYIIYIVD